jgi:hypothetical protein
MTAMPETVIPPPEDTTPTPTDSEPEAAQTTVSAGSAAVPEIAERELGYDNENIRVRIACPVISGMQDAELQKKINYGIYAALEERASSLENDAAENDTKAFKYYLESKFSAGRIDGKIVSVRVYIEFYAGGANTGSDYMFINLMNTQPGKELALADLFLPEADYTGAVNAKINALIENDRNGSDYWFSTVADGQWYYLTDTHLVIVFPRYEIAAGAGGEPEFAIKLEELSDILIPELRQNA